jgi:hypothetical protein
MAESGKNFRRGDGERVGRGTGRMENQRQKWRHSWRQKRRQKTRQIWAQQWTQHTLDAEDLYVRRNSPDYRDILPGEKEHSGNNVLWLYDHDRLRKFWSHCTTYLIKTDGHVPCCNLLQRDGMMSLYPVQVSGSGLFRSNCENDEEDSSSLIDDGWERYSEITRIPSSRPSFPLDAWVEELPFGLFCRSECNMMNQSFVLYLNGVPFMVSLSDGHDGWFARYKQLYKKESVMDVRHVVGDFMQKCARKRLSEFYQDYYRGMWDVIQDFGCYYLRRRRDGRFEFVELMDIKRDEYIRIADLNFEDETEFSDFIMRLWTRFYEGGYSWDEHTRICDEEYEVMRRYRTSRFMFTTQQKHAKFVSMKPKLNVIGWRMAANRARRLR